MPRKKQEIQFTVGSGNVFEDLGFEDPVLEQRKSDLVQLIEDAIRVRGLTQVEAGEIMGLDQPKVSHLLRGRFGGFSVYRLMDCLARLGREVEIVVHPLRADLRRTNVQVRLSAQRRSRARGAARG
jgi:predicted XRE-type DNA-binding protein